MRKVINTNKVLTYTDILIQLDLTKRVYQFFTLFHFDTHSLINHYTEESSFKLLSHFNNSSSVMYFE